MAYSPNTTLDRHKKINDSFSCTNMEKFQGGKKKQNTQYTHSTLHSVSYILRRGKNKITFVFAYMCNRKIHTPEE